MGLTPPEATENNSHPVWEVYDLQRIVALNSAYWTAKYIFLSRWNFLLEYSLLATAPTSAVAGLFFFQTTVGAIIWKYALAITAFLGVAKPLLQLSKKLEKLNEIVLGYRYLGYDLREIGNQIRRKKQYDSAVAKEFLQAQKKMQSISQQEPIDRIDEKLRDKCYAKVLEEFPTDNFFIPDDEKPIKV
jgi:hypothetical protein